MSLALLGECLAEGWGGEVPTVEARPGTARNCPELPGTTPGTARRNCPELPGTGRIFSTVRSCNEGESRLLRLNMVTPGCFVTCFSLPAFLQVMMAMQSADSAGETAGVADCSGSRYRLTVLRATD